MRQFKRRDRIVLETDRGNDSIDNDKHGIRRGGRGRFIIIYLTILPERRKAERRYQQNQQEDSSHGINPLIVCSAESIKRTEKTFPSSLCTPPALNPFKRPFRGRCEHKKQLVRESKEHYLFSLTIHSRKNGSSIS